MKHTEWPRTREVPFQVRMLPRYLTRYMYLVCMTTRLRQESLLRCRRKLAACSHIIRGELTPPVGGIRDLQCQAVFSIGTTPLPQASRTAEQSRVPTCTYIQ